MFRINLNTKKIISVIYFFAKFIDEHDVDEQRTQKGAKWVLWRVHLRVLIFPMKVFYCC